MVAFFVSIGLAVSSLVVPWVASTASASTPVVTNYTGTGISNPFGITAGPDGALWFTNYENNSIGRITTAGVVTNYTGTGISNPEEITAGPDSALWFTNTGNNSIGRITTAGVVTNYTGTGISYPDGITAGPDGALWFTNFTNSSIGRITTAGVVTNYTGTGISNPEGITAGPDGALWFTNSENSTIGRITTGGVVTNYTGTGISFPDGIAAGPDGALWFTNRQQLHRAHHDGRGRHQLHRNGHQRSGRDRRRAGRRLVVHQLRQRLHRAHHDGRGRHQLHRNGHQQPGRDHGRAGRRLVVHKPQDNSIGRITTGSYPPPTTSVLIPSNGATLSGSTTLDASASNATSVEFRLFGGVYGYNAPVLCTATLTYLRMVVQLEHHDRPQRFLRSYCLRLSALVEAHSVRASTSPPITRPRPRAFSSLRRGRRCPDRPPLMPPPRTPPASSSGSSAAPTAITPRCSARPRSTYYGWLCSWNTATVPNGSYTLVSEAFNFD